MTSTWYIPVNPDDFNKIPWSPSTDGEGYVIVFNMEDEVREYVREFSSVTGYLICDVDGAEIVRREDFITREDGWYLVKCNADGDELVLYSCDGKWYGVRVTAENVGRCGYFDSTEYTVIRKMI